MSRDAALWISVGREFQRVGAVTLKALWFAVWLGGDGGQTCVLGPQWTDASLDRAGCHMSGS